VIHLDDAGVERYGDLAAITDGLIDAWKQLAAGQAASSVRVRTTTIDKVMASGMAAVLSNQGVAGGKLYATHENGFDFLIALFGAEGGVLATIEGRVLTAMRTAAATGVAVRYLKPETATVAALFGTGYQSTWHALVLQQELELDELRICGRTPSAVDRLVAWSKDRGIPAVAAGPDEAIRDAHVVATVTAAYEPVFAGAGLAANALVCGVGSTKAERRELDAETVRRAELIYTDSVEGAKTEAGDLVGAAQDGALDWSRVHDITDVITGVSGRTSETGIVLYESQGMALQDVAAAAIVYARCNSEA
jgi:ornithine cyclodeaminase/alanine dehydrogenase-like protein (mu-crystallin family)